MRHTAPEFCSPARRGKGRIPEVCPFRNAAGGQKDKPDGALIFGQSLSRARCPSCLEPQGMRAFCDLCFDAGGGVGSCWGGRRRLADPVNPSAFPLLSPNFQGRCACTFRPAFLKARRQERRVSKRGLRCVNWWRWQAQGCYFVSPREPYAPKLKASPPCRIPNSRRFKSPLEPSLWRSGAAMGRGHRAA